MHHWLHQCVGHGSREVSWCRWWGGGGGGIGWEAFSVLIFLAGLMGSYGSVFSFFQRMPAYLLSPMGIHTLSFPSETACQSSGFTPLMSQKFL